MKVRLLSILSTALLAGALNIYSAGSPTGPGEAPAAGSSMPAIDLGLSAESGALGAGPWTGGGLTVNEYGHSKATMEEAAAALPSPLNVPRWITKDSSHSDIKDFHDALSAHYVIGWMEAVHPSEELTDVMTLRKGFFNTIKGLAQTDKTYDKVSYSMVRAFQYGYLEGTYKALEQLITKKQPQAGFYQQSTTEVGAE